MHVTWPVTVNGGEIPLSECKLTLHVIDPWERVFTLPVEVSADGSAVQFVFPGTLLNVAGDYTFVIWRNFGEKGQTLTDTVNALTLVDHAYEEANPEAEDSNISVDEPIVLDSGDLQLGGFVDTSKIEESIETLAQAIAEKADKATTIEGYGITDAKITANTSGMFVQLGNINAKIPSKTSDLTNDSGFLTQHQDISGKADKSYVDAELAKIPSKTSQLTNDSGFITQHQDISGKADKTYVDTELGKKADSSVISTIEATATSAASSASAAQASAANAEARYGNILTAMQSLPDGSAVSAKVADNTAKLSELEGKVNPLEDIITYTHQETKLKIETSWTGGLSWAGGHIDQSTAYSYSEKIDVSQCRAIVTDTDIKAIRCVTAYDADNNILGSLGSDSAIIEYVIPEGVKFVVITASNDNIASLTYYADVNIIKASINGLDELSDEFDDITDDGIVRKNNEYVPSWEKGIIYQGGVSAIVDSYYHTQKISVSEGDIVTLVDDDNESYLMRFIAAYSGGIAVSTKGAESSLEYVVPDGINEIIVTSASNIVALPQIHVSIVRFQLGKIVILPNSFHETIANLQLEIETLKKSDVLYGKKYWAVGDSYTEWSDEYYPSGHKYAGQYITYDREIRLRHNMSGENRGISGSTIALPKAGVTENVNAFTMVGGRLYQIPEDVDYLTIAFGINDAIYCNLGNIDDTDNTTFYGAWNVAIEWLLRNRPNTKIGIIGFVRSYSGFYDALNVISKKWGIPFLDTFGGQNVPPTIDQRLPEFNYSTTANEIRREHFHGKNATPPNRTHPGSVAHRWESTYIENFLRAL